ncbi:MAG: hypothetical protein WCX32_03925 [Clostridia bacterium]|jgi:hypothetical protein|nr:hypothetical protein [Clostridia bacterium]MDD4275508.1 hypothetical protein [Clostridia bacterium]
MFSFLALNITFSSVIEYLSQPSITVAIICGSLGLGFALLSKKVTIAVRKKDNIENDDSILLFMRMLGLLLIITAIFSILFIK